MNPLTYYVGIPYRAGAIPPDGADCWTLAKTYAADILGQRWPSYLYDINDIYRTGSRQIIAQMADLGNRWRATMPNSPGTLLIIRMRSIPIHCAVMVNNRDMLHTLEGRNSCIEPVRRWDNNIIGAYKWIGN